MRSLLLLMMVCVFGCNKEALPHLGECTKYFPSEIYDSPGAVWKYYVHTTAEGGQRKTDIKYRKLAFKNSKLYLKDYTADFQESYNEVIIIEDNKWKIDSTFRYDYRGSLDSLYTTLVYEIDDEDVVIDWKESNAKLKRTRSNYNWSNDLIALQSGVRDTLVAGNKTKVFYGTLESNYIVDSDTTITSFDWQREFTFGRGMTYQYFESEAINYEWQLDEIMTVEEFETRANHGTHRVAYIDPEKAIDGQDGFATCYHISKINDYYNDNRAEHLESKGGLWEMLENNLDASLLKGQEGYLTYRFVVNCKGEAGRFITEESDLGYNRVEFSDKLRKHLLEMLVEVDKWKNLTVRGEPRDAYVYITFKIKDDEIIEILP